MIGRLLGGVRARPRLSLALLALGQFLAWWAAAAMTQATLPLDMMEATAWGPGWQLVYYKHPPLPAWMAEALITVVGRRDWMLMALGPLFVGVTMLIVWRLAIRLLDPVRALAAVAAFTGILYFTVFAAEFNHNVALYPFWAGVIVFGHHALKRGATGSWLLAALCAAAGVYAKYAILLPVGVLLLIALADPAARRVWRRPGPYLGAMLGLLVTGPHLWALWRSEFAPLRYAASRAVNADGWTDHILFPLNFAAAQILALLGALLLVGLLRLPGSTYRVRMDSSERGKLICSEELEPPICVRSDAGCSSRASLALPACPVDRFDRRYVLAMTGGPLLITMIGSALTGQEARSMWGAPMWPTVGIALMLMVGAVPLTGSSLRRFTVGWVGLTVCLLAAMVAGNLFGTHVTGRGDRVNWPAAAVADAAERAWHGRMGEAPIDIVTGPMWSAGAVAFYGTGRPPVLLNGDPALSPWVPDAALAGGGILAVWWIRWEWQEDTALPDWLGRTGRQFVPLTPVTVPWETGADLPPVRIGLAVSAPPAQFADPAERP